MNNHIKQVVCLILFVFFLYHFGNRWLCNNTKFELEINGISFYVSNLYSPEERNSADMAKVISEALLLLKNNKISYSDWKTNVYFFYDICEYERKQFYIKNHSYGCYNSVLNSVSIRAAIFEKDIVDYFDSTSIYNTRKISEILAHELCHVYQRKKLGMFRTLYTSLFERWKLEGFSEYIAHSSSLRADVGLRVFLDENFVDFSAVKDSIPDEETYLYFKSRVETDYLLNYKKIPENEYWDTKYDTDKLDDEIREALQSGEYRAFEQ